MRVSSSFAPRRGSAPVQESKSESVDRFYCLQSVRDIEWARNSLPSVEPGSHLKSQMLASLTRHVKAACRVGVSHAAAAYQIQPIMQASQS